MNNYDIQTNSSSATLDRTGNHNVITVLRSWVTAYVAQYDFRNAGKVDASAARLLSLPIA
jgi:hypothetical protein